MAKLSKRMRVIREKVDGTKEYPSTKPLPC